MSLMDAPAFNERRARRTQVALISAAVLVFLLIVLTLAGYIMGHGWLFTNLPAEHKVNQFYTALETKDYKKAYALYNNDPTWEQHPDKYRSYPLDRFIDDWTKPDASPVNGPVVNHHVDLSRTDGTGTLGSGIIVAAHVNGDHKVFVYVDRSDGTFTYPSPHVIEY